jgi:putative ABC transport system permease protein
MIQDLLFSARLLRKRPGQTLVAVAALALGIGFTTAMFSILDGSFLRGLPLPEADRLMSVQRRGATLSEGAEGVRPAEVKAWRERQTSFDSLTAWMGVSMTFSGDGRPADAFQGSYVSAAFFDAAGIPPLLGRVFDPQEDLAGAPVVVIGYDLWASRYLKDPGILGKGVRMGGEPATIIGVMPKGFNFPLQQHYWSPLGAILTPANEPNIQRVEVLGKLRDGVGRPAAEAELDALAAPLPAVDPEDRERRTAVVPFVEGYTEAAHRPLWLMAIAGACVLLIACANATNLLLARGALRARELAVRSALGAARRRLLSAVLAEALLLSALGGAAGLAVAQAGIHLYNRSGGLVQSYWVDIRLDREALLFAIGATLVSAFLAGLAPALRASRADPGEALKDQTQGVTSLRAGRLGRWLVAVQVALSCALLVATGQMVESVRNLNLNDFGDRPEDVWTARLFLDTTSLPEPADWLRFYDELRGRLESLPAVRGVALTSHLPASRTPLRPVEIEGANPGSPRPAEVRISTVSPGFFSALGRPLLQGRDFSTSDNGASLPVVLVNRRFADLHFAGESPLGRRLRVGKPGAQRAWTIVGVVPDLYLNWDLYSERIGADRAEGIYFPLAQNPTPGCSLAIRTDGPPANLQPEVRRILSAIAPDLPLLEPGTLEDRIADATSSYRMVRGLFSVFSLAALVLAGIGLYAVNAVLAQQRRHEMAIRKALGARGGHTAGLIVRGAAVQVLAGAGLGLGMAAIVSRLLVSMLYGVEPGNAGVFLAAAMILLLAGSAACFVPALRSARVDPAAAFRGE